MRTDRRNWSNRNSHALQEGVFIGTNLVLIGSSMVEDVFNIQPKGFPLPGVYMRTVTHKHK